MNTNSDAKIALTQTVQKGGCAAKVAASELRKILAGVKFPPAHPELMVDGGLFDDAAIYRVTPEVAMVQTLDFFTPILDTPRLFGEVAATNALSDVYAMGGKPKTAMAILAFPLATMSYEVITEVMQGASDKILAAGANLVGGHSIDDDTLKFGLSVTGFVHPGHVWSNAGARAGDHLILTKPIGTGCLTAGLKRREWTEADIQEAIDSMCTLNNIVDHLSERQIAAVHAATDITGFGLSGHAMQLAKASGVSLEILVEEVPRFANAIQALERGFLTKAHKSNALYTESSIVYTAPPSLLSTLIHDPQTSGGLLLSVAPDMSEGLLAAIQPYFPTAKRIGEVKPATTYAVNFRG